jgi:hypothetical protein
MVSAAKDVRDEAAARAAEVGARPEVRKWIARLKKIAKDMPPDVAVFCESGNPYVLALRAAPGPDGSLGFEKAGTDGVVDQDSIIARVPRGPHGGGWDGGSW